MGIGRVFIAGLLVIFSFGNFISPSIFRHAFHMKLPLTHQSEMDISRNWSGYSSSDGVFTGVTAEWKIPNVDNNHFGADATWVGIGGVNSDDLIQAGTESTVLPDGTVTYKVFYETLPDASHNLSLVIQPGDVVKVSVTQKKKNEWKIVINNTTTQQSTVLPVSYASSLSSAEWIEEAPSGLHFTLPLDNFGSIEFKNASVVKDGKTISLSKLQSTSINMWTGRGEVLAATSTLNKQEESFTVKRITTDLNQFPEVSDRYDFGNR